jgi:hypothetical protein
MGMSQADHELDLIIDDVESIIRKPAPKIKTVKPKKEYTNVNKETYHKAKALHKAEIRKYRKAIFDSHVKVWKTIFKEIGARHQSGKSIRKHKLLKKQAKITYKLSKVKES